MLVLKKMSTKKMAIYVFIIVVMVGFTGFLLYQNLRSADSGSLPANTAQLPDALPGAGAADLGGGTAPNQPAISQLPAVNNPAQPPEIGKISNNGNLDLTILESEKYKALKENVLIPRERAGKGKRDPFKPN